MLAVVPVGDVILALAFVLAVCGIIVVVDAIKIERRWRRQQRRRKP